MQSYFSFLVQHWGLALIFLASFVWVVVVETQSRANRGYSVTPREAVEMMNKENIVIFDIRPKEVFVAGHIVSAKLSTSAALVADKKKKTLLVCDRGIASASAVKRLRKAGNANVFFIEGGIQAWVKTELPLTKV